MQSGDKNITQALNFGSPEIVHHYCAQTENCREQFAALQDACALWDLAQNELGLRYCQQNCPVHILLGLLMNFDQCKMIWQKRQAV